MDEIKSSMIVDKDELRKKELQNEMIRAEHISHDSESKRSNAITDDYLKAVEASIDKQQTEEQMVHQNAVQKTLELAKAAAEKQRRQKEEAEIKRVEAEEKAHREELERLQKEQQEHEAKVRMEKDLA